VDRRRRVGLTTHDTAVGGAPHHAREAHVRLSVHQGHERDVVVDRERPADGRGHALVWRTGPATDDPPEGGVDRRHAVGDDERPPRTTARRRRPSRPRPPEERRVEAHHAALDDRSPLGRRLAGEHGLAPRLVCGRPPVAPQHMLDVPRPRRDSRGHGRRQPGDLVGQQRRAAVVGRAVGLGRRDVAEGCEHHAAQPVADHAHAVPRQRRVAVRRSCTVRQSPERKRLLLGGGRPPEHAQDGAYQRAGPTVAQAQAPARRADAARGVGMAHEAVGALDQMRGPPLDRLRICRVAGGARAGGRGAPRGAGGPGVTGRLDARLDISG
jgi:hypothetical protein